MIQKIKKDFQSSLSISLVMYLGSIVIASLPILIWGYLPHFLLGKQIVITDKDQKVLIEIFKTVTIYWFIISLFLTTFTTIYRNRSGIANRFQN